jgi:hypothetical protein
LALSVADGGRKIKQSHDGIAAVSRHALTNKMAML